MITPEIAKKCSYLLDSNVEKALNLLLDDLISQELKKIKANSPELELRIAAVRLEQLNTLKNYRELLERSVKNHGTS